MSQPLGPVMLEGRHVRLEPLRLEHVPQLLEAAGPARIWAYMPHRLDTPQAMDKRVQEALARQAAGLEYSFVVYATGRVVGGSCYLDVSEEHRSVEIGWTWYSPEVWGTSVNPEAKYLLLRHAFERWGALRVFLKTDARNLHSQAAILKLGAQYEGTLRSHMLLDDGFRRDTKYYSILDHEWPAVKARLERRLAAALQA